MPCIEIDKRLVVYIYSNIVAEILETSFTNSIDPDQTAPIEAV